MNDPNDVAREKLTHVIGNGIEYQSYCKEELAGDFACDTVKVIEELEDRIERAILCLVCSATGDPMDVCVNTLEILEQHSKPCEEKS